MEDQAVQAGLFKLPPDALPGLFADTLLCHRHLFSLPAEMLLQNAGPELLMIKNQTTGGLA